MLERSAGKLARSVLRGLGEREPTWLPGGSVQYTVARHRANLRESAEFPTSVKEVLAMFAHPPTLAPVMCRRRRP
jgi:hypothetical protein